MSIHHGTVKKAEKAGLILEDAPEGSDYAFRAFWPEKGMELWGNNVQDLLANATYAKMHWTENHLKFDQDEDNGIEVSFNGHELASIDAEATQAEFKAAVLEALEQITDEMRAEPGGEEEDEEEQRTGSVVPEKYKALYKANGTPGNCGDWLALTLKEYTNTKGGSIDPAAVDAIAEANGLKTDKYNRTTRGWQGRLRMTVRNSLVKKVVEKGVLVVPAPFAPDDTELKAPKSWITAMAAKHKMAMDTLAPTRKKKAA